LQQEHSLPANRTPGDIGDIVYAASLAHDVGYPPFGHNGEEAIRSWFTENSDKNPLVRTVMQDVSRKNDFLIFDGNAQTFRILTRLQGWRQNGGLQLSCAVLGALMKYPFSSNVGKDKYDKQKFGFRTREVKQEREVAAVLRLAQPRSYRLQKGESTVSKPT
jgi:dGTPase